MKSNIMSLEDLYAVDFMQGGTLTGLNNITTWMFALLFPSKSALWLLDHWSCLSDAMLAWEQLCFWERRGHSQESAKGG